MGSPIWNVTMAVSGKEEERLNSSGTIGSSSARVKEISQSFKNKDPKATKILFCIVAIYFVCHTPWIIHRCVYYLDFDDRDLWLTITPIYQLALIFNSSINFVIYCLVGEDFKKEL